MKLTSGQLSQTVKYGDQLVQTVIACNEGYAWTDVDITNITKALPFTVGVNEHKNIITLNGAVNTTNKTISYTLPNPSPTVNYKPEVGNNLALVSVKESSGSYTNWSQWTSPSSVIPKYDFSKPMRLNYTNLQTGGLNAAWAMFGDHPLSNLTMNNNGSISTSTNQVEIAWGFSAEQVTLVNSHIGEVIMLYDDAGKKSGFVFEVSGANATKLGVVRFIDWPDIADVPLKAGESLWDVSFAYESYELIDMYNRAHPNNTCTWIEASVHPGVYFQPQHFTMPNPATIVEVRAKFGSTPNDYGVVTIDSRPNGNLLVIDWYPYDGFGIQLSGGNVPLSSDGFLEGVYLDPEFKDPVYTCHLDSASGQFVATEHWSMPYPPKDMNMYAKFVKDTGRYVTIVWGRDSSMHGFGSGAKWKTPIPYVAEDSNGVLHYVDPSYIDQASTYIYLTIKDLEDNRPTYSGNYVDVQGWDSDLATNPPFSLSFSEGPDTWNGVRTDGYPNGLVPIDVDLSTNIYELRLEYTGYGDIEPPPPDSPENPDEPGPSK